MCILPLAKGNNLLVSLLQPKFVQVQAQKV